MKIESFVVKDEGQDLEIEMGFRANQNTFAQITLRFELVFLNPEERSASSSVFESALTKVVQKGASSSRLVISPTELHNHFLDDITQIKSGRQTNWPHWKITLIIDDAEKFGRGPEISRSATLPLPEEWLWSRA